MHLVSKDPVAFNQSDILMDNRFDYYTRHFVTVLEEILANQEEYTWLKVENRYFDLIEEKDMHLQFLDSLGETYFMDYQMKDAISLFAGYLNDIDTAEFFQIDIDLNIDDYIEIHRGQEMPGLVKNLYFVYQNAYSVYRKKTEQEEDYLRSQTLAAAASNLKQLKYISFISIGCITFFGLLATPFITEIEQSKLKVLKYFNLLTADQVGTILGHNRKYYYKYF